MSGRKRDKPYPSSRVPYNFPKRRRPLHHDVDASILPSASAATAATTTKPSATVLVIGLSPDCSVLDLKSRFEIYGSISRTRMDPGGLAYITFRSKDSADSAIAASLDPSFPITLHSQKVQVMWANDPVPQWREGIGRRKDSPTSSKLVRAELPLSRRGRGNKLGSAIVNPRDEDGIRSNNDNNNDNNVDHDNDPASARGGGLDVPFKGREIVAYDDIL